MCKKCWDERGAVWGRLIGQERSFEKGGMTIDTANFIHMYSCECACHKG